MATKHVRLVGNHSRVKDRLAFSLLKEIALDIGERGQPAFTSRRTLAKRLRCSVNTVRVKTQLLVDSGELTYERNGKYSLYNLNKSFTPYKDKDFEKEYSKHTSKKEENESEPTFIPVDNGTESDGLSAVLETTKQMQAMIIQLIQLNQQLIQFQAPNWISLDHSLDQFSQEKRSVIQSNGLFEGKEQEIGSQLDQIGSVSDHKLDQIGSVSDHKLDQIGSVVQSKGIPKIISNKNNKYKEEHLLFLQSAINRYFQVLGVQNSTEEKSAGNKKENESADRFNIMWQESEQYDPVLNKLEQAIKKVVGNVMAVDEIKKCAYYALELSGTEDFVVTPVAINKVFGAGGWWYNHSFGKKGKPPYVKNVMAELKSGMMWLEREKQLEAESKKYSDGNMYL